ncbi:MAG TPA: hypothetical protein VLB44_00550 [Kofleriaceae bacterium]|nr:hypothetical protein [Kofleriaceae bacterium]
MSESTRDDDNELKDVDLGAGEAPEPPEDLADSVIARVGGTEVGAAVPVEEPRTRHRALLIGGVAAAVLSVMVGGYALVRSARHVAPTAGSVMADKAQTLSLDGARADLDPGTEVKWSRQGRTLHVEQRRGTAAWRVDADERLVIDAGATVASVDASGASLRVEVKMNPTDARIAGATALTAAAVAMVTVVVYEGHVKVRDTAQQRDYVVEPGTTYSVTPPVTQEPPVVGVGPVAPSGSVADVVIDAGGSVTIHDPAPPTAVQINAVFACTHTATFEIDRDTRSNGVALLSAGAHDYRVTCDSHEYLGQIVVLRDPLTRTIPRGLPKNAISADGRSYRISYQAQIPSVEVHGGPGTLHLARGGQGEKTYDARGESVVVPSEDLAEGQYTYWFSAVKLSTLTLSYDRNAPVFDIVAPQAGDAWSDQLSIKGAVILGGRLSIDGFTIPTDRDGRFATNLIPVTNRSVVPLRLDHPAAGAHYAILRAQPTTVTVDNSCDEVSCVLDNYQGACCAKYDKRGKAPTVQPAPPAQPANLDRAQISAGVASVRPKIEACGTAHPASGIMKVRVQVDGSGKVTSANITTGLAPDLDACVQKVLLVMTFPKTAQGAVFSYPFVFSAPAVCDADALKDKGMANVNMGQHAAALAQFEASLKCKDDPYVRTLAFASACNAYNSTKAKRYYKLLTPAQQQKFQVLCIRNKTPFEDSTPAPVATCSADDSKEKGMELVNLGKHADALGQFEESLRCKQDSYVLALAFMAACNSKDAPKAKLYYKQLTPKEQSKYYVMCVRNKVAYEDDAATPPRKACDADDLKDRGMEMVNMGKHQAALDWFEKSLDCKPDPYLQALAFMAACNSGNETKARAHFKLLSSDEQNKYKVMCDRNKVAYQDEDPNGAKGYLELSTKPAAKVFIDGVDTGLTTPIKGHAIPLTPGKHKVTFVIGDDRFAYFVVIQAGKTEKLSKDLQ